MILGMDLVRAIVVAAVLSLAAAGPVWAALPENPGPPQRPERMMIYGSYIAVGVLLAAVCTAVFKPSKRTHQD